MYGKRILKSSVILLLYILLINKSRAQENIYVETFGTGSGDVSVYTGWDNSSPIVYSGAYEYPGGCGAETTPVSEGYTGASGGTNIHIKPGYSGTAWLQIDGINTTGYSDITLSFAFAFEKWAAATNLSVYISTDGANWTNLGFAPVGGSTWELSVFADIPETSTLSIKFEEATRKAIYIDDVVVAGTATIIPVTGVSLSETNLEIEVGQTSDLNETIVPTDASDKSVVWSSDDNDVAIVDANGVVSALSSGQAIITVTTNDGSYTAECNVTVNCPELDTPTNVKAIKGNTEVSLTWDPVEGASGYKIYYSETQGEANEDDGIETIVDGGSSTIKKITGLVNETPYYFAILSSFYTCNSTATDEVTATPSSRIDEHLGPNIYISTKESGTSLGENINSTRIDGRPGGFNGYLIPIDFVIDISAPNADENLGACLTFSYTNDNIPEGMNLASLDLYRFDEGQNKWVKMHGTHDIDNKEVTLCDIEHLSKWTLAGSVPESVPLGNWGIVLLVSLIITTILIFKRTIH